MKRFLAIVLVVVTVAAVGWIYHSQANSPTTAAIRFLNHLSDGEFEDALRLATPTLRINTSKEKLALRAQQLGLESLQGVEWGEIDWKGNGVAITHGEANLGDLGVVGLKMQLIQSDGHWQVDYLTKTRGGLQLPSEPEMRRMIGSTLVDLSQAIMDNKFDDFRSRCSHSLQVMNSTTELRHSFLKIDYTFAKEMKPRFVKPPLIDDEGHLQMIGNYATRPSRLDFLATYAHESGGWRLLSVHIHLVDAYEQQAARFMYLLGSKSYVEAYGLTSSAFRQSTAESQFSQVVSTWQLRESEYVIWYDAETSDDVVKLSGEMQTETGKMRPVEVGMRLEQNDWMVDYIR
ncbi:MAG: hypothetical protein ACI9HK_001275 [Pirellulaceae bacterium]|jgi:hypothetical protein